MRAARNGRRWLSWLGVIAVLSNVLAGALCHMTGQAQAAAGPVDDVLGPLAICTAHGEQAPAPNGSQDPGGKSTHCATCTLLAGFALIVAFAFAAVAFPSTCIFFQLRLGARTLADHLSLGGIRSRAPPAFA
jgi:hypothetical protein